MKETTNEDMNLLDLWVDYPYIGIGEKPSQNKSRTHISEEQLEKLSY